jgi:inosine-uridine nucleoside N-ribohydrolase
MAEQSCFVALGACGVAVWGQLEQGRPRNPLSFKSRPAHDAVALAHVFRPEHVETAHRHVAIDCGSELCHGRTVVDLWRRTATSRSPT